MLSSFKLSSIVIHLGIYGVYGMHSQTAVHKIKFSLTEALFLCEMKWRYAFKAN